MAGAMDQEFYIHHSHFKMHQKKVKISKYGLLSL